MMRSMILLLALALCMACDSKQKATTPPEPEVDAPADAVVDEPESLSPAAVPLDARLKQFGYPHPTATLEISAQRQRVELVYMDVKPEGDANGKVALLLHGKNFSGAYWASTIEALAKKGWRVVAPDQVGFGKSSKPDAFQYSFHEMARHTAALLDELKLERVHVVGHSMGGMVATRFALSYPARTASLSLINPIGLEDWKRMVPYQSVDDWYANEKKKTPEGVKAYMQANYFDGTWKPAYDPLVAIQGGWAVGPDAELTAWVSALTYDMIFTQPVLYEFGAISVPTLLVIGTRDRTALGKPLVSEEVRAGMGRYDQLGKKAAEAIPGATLVEFDDVGHVPQFEVFDRYIAALTEFLDAPGSKGASGGK